LSKPPLHPSIQDSVVFGDRIPIGNCGGWASIEYCATNDARFVFGIADRDSTGVFSYYEDELLVYGEDDAVSFDLDIFDLFLSK
ncbi:hypothetical protein PMAYCL1PPCAC_30909, partial [Pristionchus mayeri]